MQYQSAIEELQVTENKRKNNCQSDGYAPPQFNALNFEPETKQ